LRESHGFIEHILYSFPSQLIDYHREYHSGVTTINDILKYGAHVDTSTRCRMIAVSCEYKERTSDREGGNNTSEKIFCIQKIVNWAA